MTATITTAAGALAQLNAVKTALLGAGGVTSLLGAVTAVYDGLAPSPTTGAPPLPRITLVAPSAIARPWFKRIGGEHVLQIDLWGNVRGNSQLLALYKAVATVLDGVRLTLSPSTLKHLGGSLSLIGIFPDPGFTPPIMHAPLRYVGIVR